MPIKFEVDSNASLDEIKRLIGRWPKNTTQISSWTRSCHDQGSRKKFREVQKAYETLMRQKIIKIAIWKHFGFISIWASIMSLM